jgi:hypothetical protein
MIDLHWTIPQSSSDDNSNTGGKYQIDSFFRFKKHILDELKSNLKSAYKELEKTNVSTRRKLTEYFFYIHFLECCFSSFNKKYS